MDWLRRYWWMVLIGAIFFGFAISVEILRLKGFDPAKRIFDFLDGWSVILVAAGTLALALATFSLIWQTRRIREVDFKRRCLDDIRHWAFTVDPMVSKDAPLSGRHDLEILRNAIAPIHAQREGVFRASRTFGINFHNKAFAAVSKLETYFDRLNEMADGNLELETKQKRKLLEAKEETRQAVADLIKSASELKVELKL